MLLAKSLEIKAEESERKWKNIAIIRIFTPNSKYFHIL
jgi:hypothetical protein